MKNESRRIDVAWELVCSGLGDNTGFGGYNHPRQERRVGWWFEVACRREWVGYKGLAYSCNMG